MIEPDHDHNQQREKRRFDRRTLLVGGIAVVGGGLGSALTWKSLQSDSEGPVAADDVALQKRFDRLRPGESISISGSYRSRTAVIRQSDVHVDFAQDTRITFVDPSSDGLIVIGDDVSISGGTLVSPSARDGSNTAWKTAVVHVLGSRCELRGMTLIGVPRVGFGIRGTGASVTDCNIEGGYPGSLWTGVETGHFGIAWDAPSASTSTRLRIEGNKVSECVQGVAIGNFGAGSFSQAEIHNNEFSKCHNHGIYGMSGEGNVVDKNIFVDCQVPIVMTGHRHEVSNNLLIATNLDDLSDGRQLTGIDMREATSCVVQANTILGRSSQSNVGVSVDSATGQRVDGNRVEGNSIYMTGQGLPLIRLAGKSPHFTGNNIISNMIIATDRVSGPVVQIGPAEGAAAESRRNHVTGNDIYAPRAAMPLVTAPGSTVVADNGLASF